MSKNQKTKTQPVRTCIVTREKLPKKDLMRLVRVADSESELKYQVEVDLRSKLKGRGANIKPDLDVLETALAKGHIERALQLGRSLTTEEKDKLRRDFSEALEEKAFRVGNRKVKFKVSQEKLTEVLGE